MWPDQGSDSQPIYCSPLSQIINPTHYQLHYEDQ